MRMAGATAFFTTFALPAILIIIIQLFGLFINPKVLSSQLINRLTSLLGPESGNQLRVTLMNFRKLAENWYITIAGFVFLIFVATTLFNVIKNAFDQIWSIKIKSHPGLAVHFKDPYEIICRNIAGGYFIPGWIADGWAGGVPRKENKCFPG
jgi:membrane protein